MAGMQYMAQAAIPDVASDTVGLFADWARTLGRRAHARRRRPHRSRPLAGRRGSGEHGPGLRLPRHARHLVERLAAVGQAAARLEGRRRRRAGGDARPRAAGARGERALLRPEAQGDGLGRPAGPRPGPQHGRRRLGELAAQGAARVREPVREPRRRLHRRRARRPPQHGDGGDEHVGPHLGERGRDAARRRAGRRRPRSPGGSSSPATSRTSAGRRTRTRRAGITDRDLAEMPPLRGRTALRFDDGRFYAAVEGVFSASQRHVDSALEEEATGGSGSRTRSPASATAGSS